MESKIPLASEMTLLDHFAGLAMVEIMRRRSETKYAKDWEDIADYAYIQAKNMMLVRDEHHYFCEESLEALEAEAEG